MISVADLNCLALVAQFIYEAQTMCFSLLNLVQTIDYFSLIIREAMTLLTQVSYHLTFHPFVPSPTQ